MLKEEIENVERAKEILTVLAEEGFYSLLSRTGLQRKLPVLQRISPPDTEPTPRRLRQAFERLGPSFIKIGQMIAQRPDVFPEEYVDEMEALEEHVEPITTHAVKDVIEESLGEPVEELFRSFEDEPLATASIAQVHRARLHSGEDVVVKVRKPGVKDQLQTDLRIMSFLVREAESVSSFLRKTHVTEIFDQFDDWTRKELDLRNEAQNLRMIGEKMKDDAGIRVPEVHDDYTTEEVLVEEYIEGVNITDADAIRDQGNDPGEIARNGIKSIIRQVLRDGFYHADPHPANLKVDAEGNIVFLDLGIVGRLSKDERHYLALSILGAANLDADRAVSALLKIAMHDDEADVEGFQADVREILMEMEGLSIGDRPFSFEYLRIAQKAAYRGIVMPTAMVSAGKALFQMEGIGLEIAPDFRPRQELPPVVKKILVKENSPRDLLRNLGMSFYENKELFEDAPGQIAELIEVAKDTGTSAQNRSLEIGLHELGVEILAAALILSGTALVGLSGDPLLRQIGMVEIGAGVLIGLRGLQKK